MRKTCVVVILTLTLLFTVGCWNRVEPEEVALVLMLGLEREEQNGDIKVIVQAANPLQMAAGEEGGGGGSPERPIWVASSTGPTVSAAIKNLNKKSTRVVNMTHTEIVLISEDLAREGIAPILDFLERERQTRAIIPMLVVEGDLRQAMEAEHFTEEMGASGISSQLVISVDEMAVSSNHPLRVTFNRLSQPGWEIGFPRLKVIEQEAEQVIEETPLIVSGLAVFKKDRMVGWLNDRETRGYNWIMNEMTKPIYVLESPTVPGELISAEIHQSSSRLEAQIQGEEVVINVNAIVEGRVQETTSQEEKFSFDSELVDSLNRRLAQAVQSDIQAALEKGQKELESDIFGFGNLIYRTRPRDWDRLGPRWEEIYPDIRVEIQVDSHVRRTGLIKDPLKIQ